MLFVSEQLFWNTVTYSNISSVQMHTVRHNEHITQSVQLSITNLDAHHMLILLGAPASLRGWTRQLTGLIRRSLPRNMLGKEWRRGGSRQGQGEIMGGERTPKLITSTHPEVINIIDGGEIAAHCQYSKLQSKRIVCLWLCVCVCVCVCLCVCVCVSV